VSARQFRDHPLQGAGADNFAIDYLRQRRSTEEPLYPHSLALRVPAQTGIVGTVLFVGFLFAAGLAVTRGSALTEGAARAGVAAAVYFAIHGSADWFWEFAGLGAPAFAWVGLAASTPVRVPIARPLRIGVLAGALVVAASFVFPWLAALETQHAAQIWRRDPGAAARALDRARTLNPLSSRADLLAGAIASRRNDLGQMTRSFRRAVDRTPDDWYAHFELALAYAAIHGRAPALVQLARAKSLNPREPQIPAVARDVVAGRRVDRTEIDRSFVERVKLRVG
jgi:tetratricopeptide (TPR) repeat protein